MKIKLIEKETELEKVRVNDGCEPVPIGHDSSKNYLIATGGSSMWFSKT